MATIDIVDMDDFVAIFPVTYRERQIGEMGFGSEEQDGTPVYPPHEDPDWAHIEADTFFREGKFWDAYMVDNLVGGELRNYEEEDFTAQWWDWVGGLWSRQSYLINLDMYVLMESVIWFDCGGLPNDSFDRVEYVTPIDTRDDDNGLSLACSLFQDQPTPYPNGDHGEIYMPDNYSEGNVGTAALSPATIPLADFVRPISGDVADPLDDAGDRASWALSSVAESTALAGGTLALRFQTTPSSTVPGLIDELNSEQNVVLQFCDFDVWDTWVADGRQASEYDDIAVSLPHLRLWRGRQQVEVGGTGVMRMSGSARLAPGPRLPWVHRANLERDRRG
ncbi:MAG: hypothetical protein ACOC9Y_05445 [Chloroflexota bacterium]